MFISLLDSITSVLVACLINDRHENIARVIEISKDKYRPLKDS